ncbi:MAG: serine/threonine protein kinase [Deltaproteobacteria bacterium]|nr:MAG: serine/threonine protein kinase [Deltaproteobacteria bacterium]
MIGKVLLDRYRIESRLGKGGMGEVFLAVDQKLERKVAIKMMLNPQGRKDRFMREMRIISQLNHPRMVAVHDFDAYEGLPFIVMEYVSGETLRDKLRKERLPPLAQVMEYALGICEGLEYIHEQGIIHRDLKPSNIMITDHEQVKIMDFGISKGEGMQTLTAAKAILGTPMYMSPEVAMGEEIDFRADLYAFGMILYEMLIGRPAPSIKERMEKRWAPSRKILHERRPELPDVVEQIVLRCLREFPEERYEKTGQLRRELQTGLIETMQSSPVDAPTRISYMPSPPPSASEGPTRSEETPTEVLTRNHPMEEPPAGASDASQAPLRRRAAARSRPRLLFLLVTLGVTVTVALSAFLLLPRCG